MSLKDDLIKAIEEAYDDFAAALAGLGTDEMAKPWLDGWGARDLAAHVIGWYRELGGVLDRMSRGERPVPEGVDYGDTDAWNARFAEEFKGYTAPQIMAELVKARDSFLIVCRSLPESKIVEGKTAWRLMSEATASHVREHAAQIREWRGRST